MRRLLARPAILGGVAALFIFTAVATAGTTINPQFAPTGTHFQSGSATCSSSSTGVTCSSYELAGVGNTNAEATLTVNYTATVKCRNHGGQIVEVKSQVTAAPTSTGTLRSKNGRLNVTSLSSDTPSAGVFARSATCPNGNWTKETQTDTIAVSGFTYTLHFVGFSGDYITITG